MIRRECGRERAGRPERLVDLELGTERLGVDREAVEVLVERGALAVLFAEDDLVVDQVEEVGGTDPREAGSSRDRPRRAVAPRARQRSR